MINCLSTILGETILIFVINRCRPLLFIGPTRRNRTPNGPIAHTPGPRQFGFSLKIWLTDGGNSWA